MLLLSGAPVMSVLGCHGPVLCTVLSVTNSEVINDECKQTLNFEFAMRSLLGFRNGADT